MPLAGALIAESLRIGAVLDDLDVTVRKISRANVGDVNAGQPLTWTFIDFEGPDGDAPRLAAALRDSLDPALGWYCDFRTDDETFVVFGGRIFQYPRGDRTRRSEAEAYARSVGVPDPQIDWPE
jgi:hypothetical protein